MKPATEGRHCRYVDLLAEEGKGGAVSSGRPFYFISHGWDRPFSELVNMCKHHFEAERQRAWRRGLPLLQLSEVGGERGRGTPSTCTRWPFTPVARLFLLFFFLMLHNSSSHTKSHTYKVLPILFHHSYPILDLTLHTPSAHRCFFGSTYLLSTSTLEPTTM